MESFNFKSVASVVDSTCSRKSRELSPSPPSLRKLTDFSITRILGLENDETRQETLYSAPVLCRHPIQTPSPQHSYSDTCPRLSPCSDNTSSADDFDSEPDQVSIHSERPPRKKRQRTTFLPTEVWELEREYRRQPYLMSEDEEDLVERLGITAKSVKYWFQNRRAKSRKEDSRVAPVYQSSRLNEFGRQGGRAMPSDRPQSLIQFLSDHLSYPMEDHLKV